MIINHNGSFYIEHTLRRKGIHHSRFKPKGGGDRDSHRSRLYKAETRVGSRAMSCPPLLTSYCVAGLIDLVVTSDEYVRLFGDTRLLIKFDRARVRSQAKRSGKIGHISFGKSYTKIQPLDVLHELAHTVTLMHGEQAHGPRFIDAFIRITELVYPSLAEGLKKEIRKEGLWPNQNQFNLMDM